MVDGQASRSRGDGCRMSVPQRLPERPLFAELHLGAACCARTIISVVSGPTCVLIHRRSRVYCKHTAQHATVD